MAGRTIWLVLAALAVFTRSGAVTANEVSHCTDAKAGVMHWDRAKPDGHYSREPTMGRWELKVISDTRREIRSMSLNSVRRTEHLTCRKLEKYPFLLDEKWTPPAGFAPINEPAPRLTCVSDAGGVWLFAKERYLRSEPDIWQSVAKKDKPASGKRFSVRLSHGTCTKS